jgi:hypothetical protein
MNHRYHFTTVAQPAGQVRDKSPPQRHREIPLKLVLPKNFHPRLENRETRAPGA